MYQLGKQLKQALGAAMRSPTAMSVGANMRSPSAMSIGATIDARKWKDAIDNAVAWRPIGDALSMAILQSPDDDSLYEFIDNISDDMKAATYYEAYAYGIRHPQLSQANYDNALNRLKANLLGPGKVNLDESMLKPMVLAGLAARANASVDNTTTFTGILTMALTVVHQSGEERRRFGASLSPTAKKLAASLVPQLKDPDIKPEEYTILYNAVASPTEKALDWAKKNPTQVGLGGLLAALGVWYFTKGKRA